MADPLEKPDTTDEPTSAEIDRAGLTLTYEDGPEPSTSDASSPGTRISLAPGRDSRPDRAWPVPQEPRLRESIAAPRPSYAPLVEWTLDEALRAAAELESDLRTREDETSCVRAFVDALGVVFRGLAVVVRVFRGSELVFWASNVDATASIEDVAISAAALSRASLLRRALGTDEGREEASRSGLVLPAVRLVEVPEPVTLDARAAVDAMAMDDGELVAVVALEGFDARRLRGLEPVLALLADRLGTVLGRLRHAQHTAFLRRYLQELFERASGPILAIAPDRTVRAVNRSALALFEVEARDMIGKDLLALVRTESHVERVEHVFRTVVGGTAVGHLEVQVRRRGGHDTRTRWSTFPVFDVDGSVGAVVSVGEDLTDVQQLEEQILHAEKLATLGQLAAGVLHELNNPLTSITIYSEHLLAKSKREGGDPGDAAKLGRIVEGAARMTKFTRALVTYARPTSDPPALVSISEIVEQSLGFCEHVLDEGGVLVERAYGEDVPAVRAVRSELHQIFVNLVTNACQAMSTADTRAQRPRLAIAIEERLGGVMVRVADNGPGIPAEHLARIFDPFFTTKGEGKGTGLGLSIVRNLVERHGGTIEVESRSQPGAPSGTTFEIRFPRSV